MVRSLWARVAIGLAIVELGALAAGAVYSQRRLQLLSDRTADAEDRLRRSRVAEARVVAETIAVKLAAHEKVVTRMVESVRVETLMVAPRTPAETVLAVKELPMLAIAHDSLQRECTNLVETCAAYRSAALAERRVADDRITGLESQVKRLTSAKASGHRWYGAPALVGGAGACATRLGLGGCVFLGLGARVGW
jgi:hypothetical protein